MLLVRCGLNEGERSGGKFKTSTSLKRGGALLIAKVGFDIESEMRLTLAESVEAERLTGSGKWAEHAPHANLTVVTHYHREHQQRNRSCHERRWGTHGVEAQDST